MENKDPNRYNYMLNMERPISKKYPRMPLSDRAAQFSAFEALVGHEDAIEETGRRTDMRIDLDETAIDRINQRLLEIQTCIQETPTVTVVYFVEDEKKSGGTYKTKTAQVKKLDLYRRNLVFTDGTEVPIMDLYDITADWMLDMTSHWIP